jgi:hypothetical protein
MEEKGGGRSSSLLVFLSHCLNSQLFYLSEYTLALLLLTYKYRYLSTHKIECRVL